MTPLPSPQGDGDPGLDERARFEAWGSRTREYNSHTLLRDGGRYFFYDVQLAWEAWQAALTERGSK